MSTPKNARIKGSKKWVEYFTTHYDTILKTEEGRKVWVKLLERGYPAAENLFFSCARFASLNHDDAAFARLIDKQLLPHASDKIGFKLELCRLTLEHERRLRSQSLPFPS